MKRKLNISEYITKPAKQSKLFDILMRALRFQKNEEVFDNNVENPKEDIKKNVQHRILLVEDNLDNQKLAKKMLEKAGYFVDIAENGQLAVEAVHNYHYDIILMDVFMPIMDGFEATQRIRARERVLKENRTPIIAVTAHAIEGYREKCFRHDMDDYVTKPIKKRILLEAVRKWIDPRPTILVADDSLDNRNLILNHLKKNGGYKLVTAKNGQEAVNLHKSRTISLILMDMEMPVMDGFTATRNIRNQKNGKDVPIIALTAHQGKREIDKCLQAGCIGYIPKPLRKQKLFEVIHQYL